MTGACRPISDIRSPELVALKRPVGSVPRPPNEAPQQWAPIGWRHSERLRRGVRLETVRAHHFGSPSCKPSAGSPSGRRTGRPGPLRASPPGADHAVPPGAAARGQLHRPHRGQHRRRTTPLHQERVRRLPRVRHPGARLPETSLRRVRPRQAAGLQLQAPRVLPVMRCAADVADRGAPGRPCHPARAGAAVGLVAADRAAPVAGIAA